MLDPIRPLGGATGLDRQRPILDRLAKLSPKNASWKLDLTWLAQAIAALME
jgi:hypothetical protein